MREVESAYARTGPHGKRLCDQHSGVRLNLEQTPKRTLLRVIGTRWIARSWPDPPVLLLDEIGDEIRVAQALFTTVTPFLAHSLVQAFGKSLCQPVGYGLRHDRVVVVVLRPEPIA